MSVLVTLAEDLLTAAILGQKTLMPSKGRMDWALTALSVLLGVAGVFLSILGLERFLEARVTPELAALVSAAVVLILSFLITALHHQWRKTASPANIGDEAVKNTRAIIKGLCSELGEPVRENPKAAMLLAALAGYFSTHWRKGL